MRLFECQSCGQPLYFENTLCDSCGRHLGYLPYRTAITALEPNGGYWKALADPNLPYKYCANYAYESCNWLVPADSPEQFCLACRHNRMIPDLNDPRNLVLWRRLENAKHRLFYSLVRLRLPLVTQLEDPAGLAFDFLARQHEPVMTGHLCGVITINLSEADDAEREKQRGVMGEPYRTLLGHFRHEIAHYYWDRIIRDQDGIFEFRRIFGDERDDYGEALNRHHANGAPPNWQENFVTAYASAHPWEDFAETWAHYFHIIDTLESARAFGITTKPRVSSSPALEGSVDFDPYTTDFDQLITSWLPLTFAFNSINRSMGLNDLYPFVIGPAIIVKLTYVSNLLQRFSTSREPQDDVTLKALAAGLRKRVAGV